MNRIVTEKEYNIHHYEVDYKRRALITSLMNYLGDVAIEQTEQLGIGIEYLMEHNLAWVIYKWDIKVHKYPMFKEKIKIRTWPFSFRKFYAYRQYEILNEKGEKIAEANSLWFMINTEKRKPSKINEEICEKFNINKTDNEILDFEKLTAPENPSVEKEFDVRYSDIDTNRHVNNVKYILWALETIPLEIVTKCTLRELRVDYEKETSYGECVKIQGEIIEKDNKYISMNSVLNSRGEELTLIKSVWYK